MNAQRVPLLILRLRLQHPPPAPRTWRSRLPWWALRLLNRILHRRPPPIAQMARDPRLEDAIVADAERRAAVIDRQAAQRRVVVQLTKQERRALRRAILARR